MTLTDFAYLEIEGSDTTATFEFNIGYDHESRLSKSYIMGERGQYVREVVNQTPLTGNFDESRRTGFWIDGGAGDWEITIGFQTGLENVTWGDTSGGTGPSNVTDTDASGADVPAISRKQILQNWLAKSKSDSGGTTRLHVGEFTSGSVTHVGSVSSGAFGEPMYVAVKDSDIAGPDPNDDNGSVRGSIAMSRVARWGGYDTPGWDDAEEAIGAIIEAAETIGDA